MHVPLVVSLAALLIAPAAACAPMPSATSPPLTPSSSPSLTPSPSPLASASSQSIAIAVTFYPQRDPDWCDPADLEMWLELDGAPLPASETAAQRALWNYEIAHNDGFTLQQWHASPYAVAATFDHFAGRSDVGDAAFDSLSAGGDRLSQSLTAGQPAIVLVDRGTHHVLVKGATLGPSGSAAPPLSVDVADPWTYSPTRDGFPAMGQDTTLSWSDFSQRFTADDPQDPGIWSGKWVVIAIGLPLSG